MKSRLAQKVENAFSVNQKIRHPVARFDFEILIACLNAELAVSVVDAELRDERENRVFDRIEF